jgi:AraC-like DNA-binding protein
MRHFLIPTLGQVHADNGGLGIFRPGWSHPNRLLTSSVLLLGHRGTVRLTVDGEPFTVTPGRLVVLPAGLSHGALGPLSEVASYFWLHFTLPEAGVLLSQDEADTILGNEGVTNHLLGDGALVPFEFDLPEPEPFEAAFRELLNLQETPSYTRWKFQVLFQRFLIACTEAVIAAHQPPQETSSSALVYGVLAWVAEHLNDPNLSIKTVARGLGVNLDYAGRRFKQVMGVSVGDYILRQRLRMALSLLEQTNQTVEAVARTCGFGTFRHFLRQFKARHGLTPTALRARHRMMHVNSL